MEKITVKVTCPRCGGRGFSEAWSFTGLTCWKCGGEGYIFQEQKIYTPEEQAKRDLREAKRIAKAQAEFEVKSAEQAKAQAERGRVAKTFKRKRRIFFAKNSKVILTSAKCAKRPLEAVCDKI